MEILNISIRSCWSICSESVVFSVSCLLGDGDAGRGHVYNPGPPTAHGSWQRSKVHAQRRQPNHRHGPGHRNPPHDRERQIQLGLRDHMKEGNSLRIWCMKPLWTEVLEIALELNYGPVYCNRMTMFLLVMSSQALKICAHQFSTWGKKSIARMSNQTLSWNNLCPKHALLLLSSVYYLSSSRGEKQLVCESFLI